MLEEWSEYIAVCCFRTADDKVTGERYARYVTFMPNSIVQYTISLLRQRQHIILYKVKIKYITN